MRSKTVGPSSRSIRGGARWAAIPRGLRALAAGIALLLPSIPLAAQIPTPESVLGHRVGADFHLATFDESIDYFQQLDDASDRLELREVGRSSFGRPVYIALISTAENLANLDRHREIALRLAHPRGLTDDEARALADEGRALVHIDGGLHASEVAHAQHTIQLAYDLVTGDDDPEIAAILDNVILMLWPSINPDGHTMIAEWYRSNLGTPYEVAPAPLARGRAGGPAGDETAVARPARRQLPHRLQRGALRSAGCGSGALQSRLLEGSGRGGRG